VAYEAVHIKSKRLQSRRCHLCTAAWQRGRAGRRAAERVVLSGRVRVQQAVRAGSGRCDAVRTTQTAGRQEGVYPTHAEAEARCVGNEVAVRGSAVVQ